MSRAPRHLVSNRRFDALHGVRILLALLVQAVTLLHHGPAVESRGDVLLLTALYLVVAVLSELGRSWGRSRLVLGTLLVDPLYVVAVLAVSGGYTSPLFPLASAHLVAVVLLTSYRLGLRVAVWYTVLFIGLYYLQVGGLIGRPGQVPVAGSASFTIVAFLLVALTAALTSRLKEQELRRSQAELLAVTRMAEQMEAAPSVEAILSRLLDAIVGGLGFRTAVLVTEFDGRPQGLSGDCTGTRRRFTPPPRVVGVSGALQLHHRAADLPDPGVRELLPGARNLVTLPLVIDGQEEGVVVAEWGGGQGVRIPTRTVAQLEQALRHAALALRNSRLTAEIQRLAIMDGLTGLPNRRFFDLTLAREIGRSRRSGTPLSLVLLDVDHFKQVNDVHGHQMGDEVLRHVGAALRGAGRIENIPARYGGEEFAVLLPACDADAAADVADRIRRTATAGAPLAVTASAGVATLPACAVNGPQLLAAADAALYAAKHAGRDRTEAAPRHARLPVTAGA